VTLISSIIADAYRESNTIPLGRAPNDNQVTEALRLYNQLLSSIYGDEAGERLEDWPLGNFGRESGAWNLPYTDCRINHPTINMRLIALNEAAATVFLTTRPQDGSRMGVIDPFSRLADFPVTLDANGRTIEGALTLTLNDPTTVPREWFYRADLGDWVKLTDLLATDENPFPKDYDSMFGILLAMRLNPRNGRELDDLSLAVLKNGQRSFVNRYLQSRPLEIDDSISWPFMSNQSYDTQRSFSSTQAFNRGSYRG
jgi:hypothetical protein